MFSKIKSLVIKIMSDNLFRATLILFAGQLFTSILNYLYNVGLGKVLSDDKFSSGEYGDFWTLNSIIFLITIPLTTLTVLTSKITSQSLARGELSKVKQLYKSLTKISIFIAISTFVVGLIVILPLSNWLKIDSFFSVLLMSLTISVTILTLAPNGIVSGLHKFTSQSIVTSLAAILKFIVGIGLALIMGTQGGIIGNLLFSFFIFVFLGLFIKNELRNVNKTEGKLDFPWKYFSFLFLMNLSMGFIISVDILFVKHYLTGSFVDNSEIDIPSIYAMLSFFGKIVFFLSYSISQALVPFSSFENEKKSNSKNVIYKILVFNLTLLIPVVLILGIFSDPLIRIIFNDKYIAGSQYLGIYVLGVLFFSIASVLTNYFISINKKYFAIIPIALSIIQIILFQLFHASIENFIYTQFSISLTLLISFIIYFWFSRNKF